MLFEALMQISKMEFYSLTQLARNLKVSEDMAHHLVEQLKAMGYIKEESFGVECSGDCKTCAGCPAAKGALPIKTLVITEKGMQALNLAN